MTNALIGTDQTNICFWKRVLGVYNRFKPPGTVERTHSQIWKKFSRISRTVKRFSGIYEIQLRIAESGRSEADVRALSHQLFNTVKWPKFTYWDEYLVLRDFPKFKAIIEEEERAPGAKQTRLGVASIYSSSSNSRAFDLNDDALEEAPSSLSRRPRLQGQRVWEARSASQVSATSMSAIGSTPRAALAHTLEVQMMKQLQDNLSLYEKSTDPETKRMYYDLILRLRSKLGWGKGSETGHASGSGDGGGGNKGVEEDVPDSDDATPYAAVASFF